MSKKHRKTILNAIQEELTLVPDENLPLVLEGVRLLQELIPPWDEKARNEDKIKKVLLDSFCEWSEVETY